MANIESCFPTHDVKLLSMTLDGVVIERPSEGAPKPNLCLDAGYIGETARHEIEDRGYIPHIRPRGEEIEAKERNPDFLRLGGGWLRFAMLGLTDLGSFGYGTKKLIGVISVCLCWPLLSSFYEKSCDKIKAILFMDKFLVIKAFRN
jgi:hypothetical protein